MSAMHPKRKRSLGKNVLSAPIQMTLPVLTPHDHGGVPSQSARGPRLRADNQGQTSRNQETGRTLDGFMLLDCCRVEFPDEVSHAVLSGMNINTVIAEDLLFFSNLTRLDLSDNEAPLEPFGCLPQLQELDFQCNALQQVVVPGNSFLSLEVLNLSFNCLKAKDIEELSKLLRIRELYLGNNWIRTLPPIMDRFSRLETLSLEHNNISNPEVFQFLAMMPRLRNLNLGYNKITAFPESALSLDNKRGAGFYNLMYLNLAYNKIANEDDVVFTAELHSLRKLVLYGNPLAHNAVASYDQTKLNYDPIPSMTAYLSQTQRDVMVLVSYPDTKKKRNAAGTYDNIEIYKILPNDVPLPSPFRTRATALKAKEADEKKTKIEPPPPQKQLAIDSSDTTFLTGVGIEDVLSNETDLLSEFPAVPTSVITRSLEVNKHSTPLKARAAANALRYQLEHPLTSHDDSDIFPSSAQRPTQAQLHRQLPRHPLQPERRRSLAGTSPRRKPFTSTPAPFKPVEGSRAIEDALTQLSYQVAKTWEKHPQRTSAPAIGEGVEDAMDSLVATAQKVNLVFHQPS